MTMLPNQPDAVNPAIVLWFAIDGQWRRVTDLERWPSQADQESRHMKATGHGYVGYEAYVVGSRRRPDDNDHRCGAGCVLASPALLAARSTSLGGQPDGPANGRQLARRVAMRTLPVAGPRR